MNSILTPEDKKYLRFICRMLQSYGLNYGYFDMDMDYSIENISYSDIDVRQWDSFSNNYSISTPENLFPILEKIMKKALSEEHYSDVDDINYGRIELFIDSRDETISVKYFYTYYETGNSSSVLYDASDEENVKKVLETLSELGIVTDELTYDGSGDSGYISDTFSDSNESVPADVEDFCYRALENSFGGWEINEGSQGTFYFNTKKGIIELSHTYNEEISETINLYNENFSK